MMKRLISLIALFACAHAFGQQIVVRSCAAAPPAQSTTASNWGACPSAQWSLPSASLVVDAIPASASIDSWVPLSTLKPGDRVFACDVANVVPGPFGAGCVNSAGTVVNWSGQTDSWVNVTSIPLGLTVTVRWTAPTQFTDGTAIPSADSITFNVYGGAQASSLSLLRSNVVGSSVVFQNVAPGSLCFAIAAVVNGAEGPQSSPATCATLSEIPGAPTNVTVTVKP